MEASDVLERQNQLRLRNIGCDVIYEIGAKSFPAHRAMLMAQLEYFQSMFTADMREKKELTVQFDPLIIHPDCFGEILNYIYTLQIDINNENIRAIYIAADYFCFDELTNKAEKFMKSTMNVENVVLYWNISVEFNLESLGADCKQLLIVSSSAVSIKNQLILTFSLEELKNFTDALKENGKFEDMFDYSVDWVLYDKANRIEMLPELLKNIPEKSLSSQFIKRKVPSRKSVFSDSDWLELLFHTLELNGSDNDSHSETLYAIGGCDKIELSSVSRYNSVTRRWTATTPMPNRRTHFGCAVIDPKIYVCGGYDGCKNMNSLTVFDTHTQTWTQLTPMKHPRQLPGVAALNEQIYVAGGSNKSKLPMVERYNIQTAIWEDVAPMSTKRDGLELVALNGFLYAIGGHDGTHCLNSVERYDPEADQWTVMNNMNDKYHAFGSAVWNGNIYIVGDDKCEVYSAADDKWTKMPIPSKCNCGKLVVCNGKLYAIGGEVIGEDWKGIKTVEVFDFQARVWRQEPDMDVARCYHEVAVVKH